MKLLFISATMAVFAAAPGAVASSSSSGVESYDYEPSSASFDVYPQDSASSEDGLMDSKDEPVDNSNSNVFATKKKRRPTQSPTPMPTLTPFDQGREAGRDEADRLWRNAGNSCSSAWGSFQKSVNRQIRTKGWNRGGNGDWRKRAFNKGASAGMKEGVVEKEKECFRDSADECVDLGNAAAREIAYSHCGIMGMNSVSKKWRRNCRDAAVDQCRGQVSGEVRDECGGGFSTNELRTLQNKCRNKVLTMIGDRSEDYDYSEDLFSES